MKTVREIAGIYVSDWVNGVDHPQNRDVVCDKLRNMPPIVAAAVVAEMMGMLRASYPDQLPLLRGRLEDEAQRALRFVFQEP